MKNPNAFVAAVTAVLAGLLVSALKHWGIGISTIQALAIVGGCITAVLWVGREGISGAIHRIWDGAGNMINGSDSKTDA